MVRSRRLYAISLSAFVLLTGGVVALLSQTTNRALIRERVDESKLITLGGNTRPEARTGNDQGAVRDELVMDHMMLQLKRSPQQEAEAAQFAAQLNDPKSPNYHQWISASEYGKRFGAAESDVRTVTDWLASNGFTVNTVYPGGMVVDFSGTAGQIRSTFHTEIHSIAVNGVQHIANISDPQIPQALAPAVAGVVSMHDFRPHAMARPVLHDKSPETGRAQYTYTYSGNVYQAMVPADLATIYDFNPLFAKGISGKGQTVVVIEDTNLYRTSDWTTFRSTFGLSQYPGSLTTVQPAPVTGTNNCTSPGVTSDDEEAILDAEWASAAAPGAVIELASCANTAATSGLMIAMQNVVNAASPPAIISVSYGECEAYNGASQNASFNTLFQQAATEGISVFVSSGDQGAAACDAGAGVTQATHGIGVSGYASTPYNVAVGGTDFADVYNGTTSQYWSSTNSTSYGSALSYIPETPWNDSCAGSLFASSQGYAAAYGSNGFCSSNTAVQGGYQVVAGGSGGPSGCATGAPSVLGIVSGTCQGVPKPSWQTGVTGIANDGVRDIPDVSMFASDGAAWGRYSVICFTDAVNGGTPCRGAPLYWTGVGGTSLSSPVMAGVQALVNQSVGSAQGNPNPVYYSLAAKVPGVFHSITQGDIDVNCAGPTNCFGYIGTVSYGRGGRVFGTTYGGALSVSGATFTSAYAATPGNAWNFATGLGSVDVNNLVTNWTKH